MNQPVLLTDVEVEGRRVDVRVSSGTIVEIGTDLDAYEAHVVDGAGGALLPGLHDHHVHLNAMAAARRSVQAGPPHVKSATTLGETLAAAPTTGGWIRAVGYHEEVAGDLDRDLLDTWVPDRPLRVQHRSGALWVLNSVALDLVKDCLDDSPDVERNADGRPNGRLWRYDARLIRALPDEESAQREALRAVATQLLDLGITGVTDATPDLAPSALSLLSDITPVRVHLLGVTPTTPLPAGMTSGARKLLLHDHHLPDYEQLMHAIDPGGTGPLRQPVAVHCVSRESLLVTLLALEDLGVVPGDRIEHAAVVPSPVEDIIARLGIPVVTQPDFLRTRGDAYLRDVDVDDRPFLYRWRGLVDAGVHVVASSDAPFGEVNPWQVMRTARDRTTEGGITIGANECATAAQALKSYLTTPHDPGGPPRQITVGVAADLCLLTVGIEQALHAPSEHLVRLTLVNGEPAGSRPWPG